jgi:hypothetical protein
MKKAMSIAVIATGILFWWAVQPTTARVRPTVSRNNFAYVPQTKQTGKAVAYGHTLFMPQCSAAFLDSDQAIEIVGQAAAERS